MFHGLIFNITEFPHLSRPVGGHRIAHFLRNEGWDIEVVDWANFWSLEELKEFYRSRKTNNTKFIGLSKMFSFWPDIIEEFTSWVKKTDPNVKIISGSSVAPLFKTRNVDYYIKGFGEYAILNLLKYITGNGKSPSFTIVDGVKLIDANTFYSAFPMQDLSVKYQDRDFILTTEWLSIESSRGCKFKCAFCNFPILGVKGDYSRDAENFDQQIRDAYDRFGVQNYLLTDETFNDRTEKITKFADVVEKLSFTPYFTAFTRADLLVSRPMDRIEMARMNCSGHYYGIESFNPKTAKIIGKGMQAERLKQGLQEVKDFFIKNNKNYRATISLIIGAPFEPKSSIEETTQWLLDNWQGESFIPFHMAIPAGGLSKESLVTENLSKYGYKEIDKTELSNDQLQFLEKIDFDWKAQLLWKNDFMDIFESMKIVKKLLLLKRSNDFRPSPFSLARRTIGNLPVSELIKLTSNQADNLLDNDISWYINKKIN
jgi:radical SAM superfamily enzyme YgiQ (UPF0313 family)